MASFLLISENPLLLKPGVLRNNPLEWTENGKAVISYDPDVIRGSHVDIELFGYKVKRHIHEEMDLSK